LPGGYKPTHAEIKRLTSITLDMLIEQRLLTQAAQRALKKSAQMKILMEFADKAWREEELPPLLQEMGVVNAAELEAKLAEQGRSLDAIRESYKRDILARGYMEQKLRAKITPSDSDLRDYYNAHRGDFSNPAAPASFDAVQEKVRRIVQRQKTERESNALIRNAPPADGRHHDLRRGR